MKHETRTWMSNLRIIVTENYIQLKTVSSLWAKSAVKGDLFKPTEMLECIHINIGVSVFGQTKETLKLHRLNKITHARSYSLLL